MPAVADKVPLLGPVAQPCAAADAPLSASVMPSRNSILNGTAFDALHGAILVHTKTDAITIAHNRVASVF